MAEYKVETMATVWYQVFVEADNADDALQIGQGLICNEDEGVEVYGSWEWDYDTYSVEEM